MSPVARPALKGTNRLIADIPTWTTHDPSGRTIRRHGPNSKSGIDAYLFGGSDSWCYLCGREHDHDKPCAAQTRVEATW